MVEEIEIVRRVINGDRDAFRLLVQRYQRPVLSMIGNIVHNLHDCEDIAQDVFFTAYCKLGSFDLARSNFSTWLFTIARNKSLNALKKKKATVIDQLPERTDEREPQDKLAEKQFYEQLDKTLEKLPPRQKAAFVMAEFVGLSYQEISQIEGVKIGTVRSRISKAKQKLRSLLKDLDGGQI